MRKYVIPLVISFVFLSCNRDVTTFNDIHFSFAFDSSQERLDNFGLPAEMPAGNAGQSPDMQLMSVHYIELTEGPLVQLGDGVVLYTAPETNVGGANAIDFAASAVAGAGEEFIKLDLSRLPAGTYNYLRASVAYQQFGVDFNLNNIPVIGDLPNQSGILASFIGFNTFITQFSLGGMDVAVNSNKEQGFWAFATQFSDPYSAYNAVYTGQAPAGATTVVNPIDATSPVPDGSCVITGAFAEPLVIEEGETRELYITLSFSTNQSFEWIDVDMNGEWDVDASEPEATEQVVDMGLRGMIPTWEWRSE